MTRRATTRQIGGIKSPITVTGSHTHLCELCEASLASHSGYLSGCMADLSGLTRCKTACNASVTHDVSIAVEAKENTLLTQALAPASVTTTVPLEPSGFERIGPFTVLKFPVHIGDLVQVAWLEVKGRSCPVCLREGDPRLEVLVLMDGDSKVAAEFVFIDDYRRFREKILGHFVAWMLSLLR